MRKGFTLSEVLITLSVVGIVAVLTVPGVMRNYQNRLYTAQLEKTYSLIANAAQSIMTAEHVDNFYETSGAGKSIFDDEADPTHQEPKSGIAFFLANYFKATKKNCSDKSACAEPKDGLYTRIDGAPLKGVEDAYCVLTVNGAAICGYPHSEHCTSLIVDVNGIGRPNVAGRDVFAMDIHSDGSISDFKSGCENNNQGVPAKECATLDGSVAEGAAGCLNNIMESGWAMEY